jgi:hypothetical protein
MLSDEVLRAQARTTEQAAARDARHAARSRSKSTSKDTSPPSKLDLAPSTTNMEEPKYHNIIDSIPIFSGEPHENINDWLDIVLLKFDIIGYDSRQKRRFIPQYLAGNALKWHLAHRDDLVSWDDYTRSISSAFPRAITTSRDMNLKMLQDRKQGDSESFTPYYTSVVNLCHQYDPDMPDLQIIDWIKAGMKLNLYERLQGEEFLTPQTLLIRAQRLELDNAVLDARKREYLVHTTTASTTPPPHSNNSERWDQPTYYQPYSPSNYTPSFPPPLMSIPYSAPFVPSYNTGPGIRSSFSSQPSPYPSSSSPVTDSSMRPRRPIVCYSCGQPGHISPHCPSRPKV